MGSAESMGSVSLIVTPLILQRLSAIQSLDQGKRYEIQNFTQFSVYMF